MADPVPADNKVATKKSKRQRRKKKKQRKKKANVGPTPAVPNDRKQTIALEYLHLWTVDKEAWSFKKKPQYWLLSNMYNKAQIKKSDFKLLLKYLEGLKGYQRSKLVENAQEIVENYSTVTDDAHDKLRYKRAKKILSQLCDE